MTEKSKRGGPPGPVRTPRGRYWTGERLLALARWFEIAQPAGMVALKAACRRFRVPFWFAITQMAYESNGVAGIRNSAGGSDYGLFQLTAQSHEHMRRLGYNSRGDAAAQAVAGVAHIRTWLDIAKPRHRREIFCTLHGGGGYLKVYRRGHARVADVVHYEMRSASAEEAARIWDDGGEPRGELLALAPPSSPPWGDATSVGPPPPTTEA